MQSLENLVALNNQLSHSRLNSIKKTLRLHGIQTNKTNDGLRKLISLDSFNLEALNWQHKRSNEWKKLGQILERGSDERLVSKFELTDEKENSKNKCDTAEGKMVEKKVLWKKEQLGVRQYDIFNRLKKENLFQEQYQLYHEEIVLENRILKMKCY